MARPKNTDAEEGIGYVPLRPGEMPDPGTIDIPLDQAERVLAETAGPTDAEVSAVLREVANATRNARANRELLDGIIAALISQRSVAVAAAQKLLRGLS